MNLADTLGGVLRVQPGRARPHSLVSTRRDWAGVLARGRPAHTLPALLASVFSLCGHAHRLCAGLAVRAAAGDAAQGGPGAGRALQQETLREHVRRIGLDWPARLAAPGASAALVAQSGAALHDCPVLTASDPAVTATHDWLEQQLLGMAPASWLVAWEHDPERAFARWCEGAHGWLPTLMRQCRAGADLAIVPDTALHVHADPVALHALAGRLREDPGLAQQPDLDGRCAETGPWTRLNDPSARPPSTPWQRLAARLAELVRLSLPDAPGRSGAAWLRHGALVVGPGEGLAWVEMARGLLLHHVRLERAALDAPVLSCQVLAPTEWNFHPQGAVARALEGMIDDPAAGGHARVEALMAAYDPCVRFEVALQPSLTETAHA